MKKLRVLAEARQEFQGHTDGHYSEPWSALPIRMNCPGGPIRMSNTMAEARSANAAQIDRHPVRLLVGGGFANPVKIRVYVHPPPPFCMNRAIQ